MVVASMKPLAMLRCVGHIMSHANGAGVSRDAGELSVVVIVYDASGRGPECASHPAQRRSPSLAP